MMTTGAGPSGLEGVRLDVPGARALAEELLGDVGTRWPHVSRAGMLAELLASLFDEGEGELLVAAATLHDIGYSPRVARTGFHPLDGGLFLRERGYGERLAALVAHHSLAAMTAALHGVHDLEAQFPREQSLLVDALVYADMHSAPDGRTIPAEERLADIATRHTHSGVAQRANLLRASMARVGAALDRLGSSATRPAPELPRDVIGPAPTR